MSVYANTPEIGQKIREARQAMGLSINEIASRAGVNEKTWRRYEHGEPIISTNYGKLLKVLHNPSFLLDTESDYWNAHRKPKYMFPFITKQYGIVFSMFMSEAWDAAHNLILSSMISLQSLPRGTHVGELCRLNCGDAVDMDYSIENLDEVLPRRYMVRYDYEFMYDMCVAFDILTNRWLAADEAYVSYGGSIIEEIILHVVKYEFDGLGYNEAFLKEDADLIWADLLSGTDLSPLSDRTVLTREADASPCGFDKWFVPYTKEQYLRLHEKSLTSSLVEDGSVNSKKYGILVESREDYEDLM